MMEWIGAAGVVLTALAWMLIPGLIFGIAADLRGLALVAFAPVASSSS